MNNKIFLIETEENQEVFQENLARKGNNLTSLKAIESDECNENVNLTNFDAKSNLQNLYINYHLQCKQKQAKHSNTNHNHIMSDLA